jgi:hypothetical protein
MPCPAPLPITSTTIYLYRRSVPQAIFIFLFFLFINLIFYLFILKKLFSQEPFVFPTQPATSCVPSGHISPTWAHSHAWNRPMAHLFPLPVAPVLSRRHQGITL